MGTNRKLLIFLGALAYASSGWSAPTGQDHDASYKLVLDAPLDQMVSGVARHFLTQVLADPRVPLSTDDAVLTDLARRLSASLPAGDSPRFEDDFLKALPPLRDASAKDLLREFARASRLPKAELYESIRAQLAQANPAPKMVAQLMAWKLAMKSLASFAELADSAPNPQMLFALDRALSPQANVAAEGLAQLVELNPGLLALDRPEAPAAIAQAFDKGGPRGEALASVIDHLRHFPGVPYPALDQLSGKSTAQRQHHDLVRATLEAFDKDRDRLLRALFDLVEVRAEGSPAALAYRRRSLSDDRFRALTKPLTDWGERLLPLAQALTKQSLLSKSAPGNRWAVADLDVGKVFKAAFWDEDDGAIKLQGPASRAVLELAQATPRLFADQAWNPRDKNAWLDGGAPHITIVPPVHAKGSAPSRGLASVSSSGEAFAPAMPVVPEKPPVARFSPPAKSLGSSAPPLTVLSGEEGPDAAQPAQRVYNRPEPSALPFGGPPKLRGPQKGPAMASMQQAPYVAVKPPAPAAAKPNAAPLAPSAFKAPSFAGPAAGAPNTAALGPLGAAPPAGKPNKSPAPAMPPAIATVSANTSLFASPFDRKPASSVPAKPTEVARLASADIDENHVISEAESATTEPDQEDPKITVHTEQKKTVGTNFTRVSKKTERRDAKGKLVGYLDSVEETRKLPGKTIETRTDTTHNLDDLDPTEIHRVITTTEGKGKVTVNNSVDQMERAYCPKLRTEITSVKSDPRVPAIQTITTFDKCQPKRVERKKASLADFEPPPPPVEVRFEKTLSVQAPSLQPLLGGN